MAQQLYINSIDNPIIENTYLNSDLHKVRERIIKLNDITKIQCYPVNGNHDEYMRGLANGLILACAIMNDIDNPKFIEVSQKG